MDEIQAMDFKNPVISVELSKESKGLLFNMLQSDPSLRITVSEIYYHPALPKNNNQGTVFGNSSALCFER